MSDDPRATAGRLVAGEDEARRRIARELHDDHCQRLAALALELRALRNGVAGTDRALPELDAVGAGLAELAEDLRRLSHDLHPAVLERHGLAEALRDHCAEIERRSGLRVRASLRVDAAAPLPPDLALGLYRIAQEALANAVRHAGARTAHVTLRIAAGEAHLAVADDGDGFDPGAARRAGGLGLAIVEERTRLLGGRCRIASAPGAGAEIEVTLPLPAPEPVHRLPATAGDDPRPRYIGPYRLLAEIGGGPTATVYLAEEPEPLGRRVAVKLHASPLPARRETLRFKAEQQALARLHHPAIAQVYEARTTEEGDLYIVMEHVPGLPITDYCDRHRLDLRRRLELFAAVCDGVQHAHRRGVLHRDLEPTNILVVEQEGAPAPKIIDFGIAKGLDRPLGDITVWSAEEPVGTPDYLAPEALGEGEADIRSDVYSLGAVLHELLAGAPPAAVDSVPPAEDAREHALLTAPTPPTPSQRLRSMDTPAAVEAARRRGLGSAAQLARRLAGDLDSITAKALARDPAARYPTVDALGREVRRALAGEPVEAGPAGALHQVGRLVRRHRRIVASAALVVLALAGGLIAAARQARRAEQEATRADAVARFLEDLFEAADPRRARGQPPSARDLLQRGTERLGRELRDQPLLRARLLDTLGGIHTELGLFDRARPLLAEALAIRERLRGPDHPEVAETLVRLGRLAQLSGQGDAVPLFRRALAIREARLGPEAPEVAATLNDLGTALAAQGRFDEAEATLRRTLALQEQLFGGRDPRVAKTLHNLAGIAYYRGRTDDSERLLSRALAIREAALPKDDLDLAGSREALALLRQKQGRPAEAAALLAPLAATLERVYGPAHPRLADALLNLGLARAALGEDAAAQQLLERSLAIDERLHEPGHPGVVRALAALADHHFEHRRYAAAEPLYRRLLALRAQGARYEGWDTVLASWARLLRATGREKEAALAAAGTGRR